MSTTCIALADALDVLTRGTVAALDRQIVEPGLRETGGLVRADWGIDDLAGSIGLPVLCGLVLLARRLGHATPADPPDSVLLERGDLGIDYCLRNLRPSGLPDLRDCNYDSSPDAGFCVQLTCLLLDLAQSGPRDPDLDRLLAKIEEYTRRSIIGMLTGGFHTPNHRWVMSSALAQAARLFPDIEIAAVLESYLAEGVDIDKDGMFLERSAGVYDAICDRSLLLISAHSSHAEAAVAARRNLVANLQMLHPDGTIETGLSRRQDYGTRSVPATLAPTYLLASCMESDPAFLRAAQWLWQAGARTRNQDATFTTYALLKYGEQILPETALPKTYSVFFKANKLWRVRTGALSASFFGGRTRLMTLVFGEAELTSLKISQSYFGEGQFVADKMEVTEDRGVMRFANVTGRHRPGYELPLGRLVPAERYFDMLPERAWRRMPPCAGELHVTSTEDGLTLRYRTLDGLDGVATQIALDFPPGGVWETADTALRPAAGQVLFLKSGNGRMRFGHDVIDIGPGADAHRMWEMRDAETAPTHVRVLLTFMTPIDHQLTIRAFQAP